MAGHAGKQSLKKNPKSKLKARGLVIPLTASSKDKPVVPIEEIRRQGLMLAWQGIGEGTRARTLVPAAPVTRAPVSPKSGSGGRARSAR